jgi:hypothetical protein
LLSEFVGAREQKTMEAPDRPRNLRLSLLASAQKESSALNDQGHDVSDVAFRFMSQYPGLEVAIERTDSFLATNALTQVKRKRSFQHSENANEIYLAIIRTITYSDFICIIENILSPRSRLPAECPYPINLQHSEGEFYFHKFSQESESNSP